MLRKQKPQDRKFQRMKDMSFTIKGPLDTQNNG
jgi:hypothetical protein